MEHFVKARQNKNLEVCNGGLLTRFKESGFSTGKISVGGKIVEILTLCKKGWTNGCSTANSVRTTNIGGARHVYANLALETERAGVEEQGYVFNGAKHFDGIHFWVKPKHKMNEWDKWFAHPLSDESDDDDTRPAISGLEFK